MSWTCRCELGDIGCQQGKRKERQRLYLVIVRGEEYRLKNESEYKREKKVKSSFVILGKSKRY